MNENKNYDADDITPSKMEFNVVYLEDGSPALCYTSTDATCAITIEGYIENKEQTSLCVMLFDAGRRATYTKVFDDVICAISEGQSLIDVSKVKDFDGIVNACKQYEMVGQVFE